MTQLNCRPGDLAIVVRSYSPLSNSMLGKIVHVLAPYTMPSGLPGWHIDPVPCPYVPTRFAKHVSDRVLRPLRMGPGTDETLTWKEKETPA